jgi:hypothetical protein
MQNQLMHASIPPEHATPSKPHLLWFKAGHHKDMADN